jgi:glycosyltransferase involved in cell wall biosynthesis
VSAIELSAIVLCYRAERSILQVVEPLYDQLQVSGVSFELVLVANYNKGQVDETPAVVEEFARGRQGVRVLAREKEGGMGWDMRSGVAAACGDYRIIIDGDAQNPVEDVLRAYAEMKRVGADVIKGRRIARFDGPSRRLVSIVYNLIFRLLFGTHLWDINGKPKGLTRAAAERLQLRSDDWFVDAEIVLQAHRLGMRIAEFPVIFRENEVRASFVRPSAILEFIMNMLRYRFRRVRP